MNTLRIAVYCSAREGLPESWKESARRVGQMIGSKGATLVYGGVDAGLMSIVANNVKVAGGRVVGIIPARLRNRYCPANDIQLSTGSLHERKRVMDIMSDLFIVLPGGYGTLDELATTFSYLNFTHQKRPVILLNLDGVYDPLIAQFEVMKSYGLLDAHTLDILHISPDVDHLAGIIDRIIESR
ncbi:MAG: TIGR00730 family Rossman fold protein [Bacteroidales bacterium]|nr:TIGR00730 family Rossman fold protein [Bacteroidales bacterium]